MRIRDLLSVQSIELGGKPGNKTEVLNHMVDLMAKGGNIADVETYRKGVFAREEEGTTGIGMGIAIPHCKSDAVKAPGLAAHASASSAVNTTLPQAAPGDAPRPFPSGVAALSAAASNCG